MVLPHKKLIIQVDANDPQMYLSTPNLSLEDWLLDRFAYFSPGLTTIGTLIWDMGLDSERFRVYTRGKTVPFTDHPTLRRWAETEKDWLDGCIAETHKRGWKAFWNHRIAEIDFAHEPWAVDYYGISQDDPRRTNPIKVTHPDWVVPCWWPQGLWNLAAPGIVERKLRLLSELVRDYPLDGLQIDFTRHTPFLPRGREWEFRECVTDFLRKLRYLLSECERQRGFNITLAVKVGEHIAGNCADGLDISTWLAEHLVDQLSIGGRSAVIDFDEFRHLPGGNLVKMIAFWDGHHTAEGFHRPSLAQLYGVIGNFYEAGADGIGFFNWFATRLGEEKIRPQERELLLHGDDLGYILRQSRSFQAEGRGEYPWAGNWLYRCDDRILPLETQGGNCEIPVSIFAYSIPKRLQILVEGITEAKLPGAWFNGQPMIVETFCAEIPDFHSGFELTAVSSYPAVEYSIPESAPLLRGQNMIKLNFQPGEYVVRRVVVYLEAK